MIFLIILNEFILPYGYNKLHITSNNPYQFKDLNSSIFFFNSKPLKIDIFNKNEYSILNPKQFVHFYGINFNISTFSNNDDYIDTWNLPFFLCPSGSISIMADHLTSFNTYTPNLIRDFCIISQFNTIAQYINGIFYSSFSNCKIEFYENDINIPKYIIFSNNSFSLSFLKPFFFKFQNCKQSFLNTSIKFSVSRDNIKSEDCYIKTIPSISKKGGVILRNPLGIISLNCYTASGSYLQVLSIFIIFLLFLISIILFYLNSKENKKSFFEL